MPTTRTRPASMTPLHPDGGTYYNTIIGTPGAGTGRRELWAATSADRTWRYRRVEVPGTPWALDRWNPDAGTYLEVDRGFTSLDAARTATEDRAYLADLRARLCGLTD